MVRYSVILSRQDGTPMGVGGFYDVEDAIDYASDWPGTATVIDTGSGEVVLTLALVPGDDGMPS